MKKRNARNNNPYLVSAMRESCEISNRFLTCKRHFQWNAYIFSQYTFCYSTQLQQLLSLQTTTSGDYLTQSILKFQFLYNMSLFLSKTKSATALLSPSRRTYITFVSKQYLVQNKTFPEIISHKKRNTVPPMDAKADTASYQRGVHFL